MTVPSRMSIYPAVFSGSITFTQVRAYDIDPALALNEVYPGGLVDRQAVIESHADPRWRLETQDLQKVFQNVDIATGLCPTSALFQAQVRSHCGIFEGAGEHVTFSNAGSGFLFVERFTWTQDDPDGAMAYLQYIPFYDGTNKPIFIAQDQNLTGTASYNSVFYGGKFVAANGASVLQTYGLRNLEVDTGIVFSTVRADGDVYARTGSIIKRQPVITATFISEDAVRTDPAAGSRRPASFFNGCTASTLYFYLYRGLECGTRYPLAGTNHIEVSIVAPQWHISRVSGRDERDVETTWRIMPVSNDWNLAINQAVL